MASSTTFLELIPEEILEEIIGHSLHRVPNHAQRPQWHTPRSSPCSPLYVSKQWRRIGTPLLYADVELSSYEQATLLQRTLAASGTQGTSDGKTLARYIRHLTIHGIWTSLGPILLACGKSLITLDMTLDATSGPWAGAVDDEESERVIAEAQGFCDALHRETSGCGENLRVLKVRKASSVYLTVTKVKHVLGMLASAVKGWDKLEDAQLLFRMSDDSSARSPVALSPAQALAPFTNAPPVAANPVQASLASTLASVSLSAGPTATIGVSSGHQPTAPITVNTNVSSSPSNPSSTSPTSPSGGPITQLTASLSTSPSLRTFVTQLPSLWNTTVLAVAQNERLEKVVLLENIQGPAGGPHEPVFARRASFAVPAGEPRPVELSDVANGGVGRYPGTPVSITSTGMWMLEARKHPRLVELVKAGSPSVPRPRIRAFTSMRSAPTQSDPPSSPGASSSTISPTPCVSIPRTPSVSRASPTSPSRSRAPPSAFGTRNAHAAAIASSAAARDRAIRGSRTLPTITSGASAGSGSGSGSSELGSGAAGSGSDAAASGRRATITTSSPPQPSPSSPSRSGRRRGMTSSRV